MSNIIMKYGHKNNCKFKLSSMSAQSNKFVLTILGRGKKLNVCVLVRNMAATAIQVCASGIFNNWKILH